MDSIFKWRLEGREFHKTLLQWWEDRGFVKLTPELLPERIYVISDREGDLYAIPVYTTDSQFCWMGFPTGNPEFKDRPIEWRQEAFKKLVEVIETTLKYNGFSRLITTSMHPFIMDNLEHRGFLKTDEGTNFYIKILE